MNNRRAYSAAFLLACAGAAYAAPALPTGVPASIDLESVIVSQFGSRMGDSVEGGGAGFSVANAGDVNGDGIADIIIGASDTIYGPGIRPRAYVVFGAGTKLSNLLALEELDATDGFAIDLPQLNPDAKYSSISVSGAGDINGDKIADVVIGSGYADSEAGEYAGHAWVIFGRKTATSGNFPASLDVTTLDGTNGFAIPGQNPDDFLGSCVAGVGDINGDKLPDIAIGIPRADPTPALLLGSPLSNAGRVYVIYGRKSTNPFPAVFNLSTISFTTGVRFDGEEESGRLGSTIAGGDVNADKISDIIIGARGAASAAGRTYIVHGQKTRGSSGFQTSFVLSTLNGPNGYRLDGIDNGDQSGASVACTGDINGDKINDIIVGAPFANSFRGECYVVYGRKTAHPASINLSTLNADTTGFFVAGAADGDRAGHSVAPAGDTNGDKIADFIVGSPGADSEVGRASVIHGRKASAVGNFPTSFSIASIDGTNGVNYEGDGSYGNNGLSVAAGDFNADGAADVLMSAPGITNVGLTHLIYAPAPEVLLYLISIDSVFLQGIGSANDGGTINMGNVVVNETSTLTFELFNQGIADLNISKLKGPRGFAISSPPDATISALTSSLFNLTFTPTRTGSFTGKLTFTNNDPDEKKFDVTLNWNVVDTAFGPADDATVIDVDTIIDLDGDWRTTTADIVPMLRAMAGNDLSADFNHDAGVNADDLAILLSQFSNTR